MNIPEIIQRKRDGRETTPAELEALLGGLVRGTTPEYQVAAWLMAVHFQGMTPSETASFTRLMMESGEVLDLGELPGIKVDKHSTGGVGDKISIPLAPLVASAGVTVPMISGRGLGHTGGTLDKLESIPGLSTTFDPAAFRRIVADVGFAIVGASETLVPADSKLYALRDVTATVPSIPLITGSILSKKYAAGVDALVLDVKSGTGAFMREHERAVELARVLVSVSKEMGKKATALVTSMDQPLGAAVGNALEVVESIDVLRGGGPDDVRELTLTLGTEMVLLAGLEAEAPAARERLESELSTGRALEKFREWVSAQGGDPSAVDDPAKLPAAPVQRVLASESTGWIAGFETREIGLAANALGAGRAKVGDEVDPAVGFLFRKKLGDRVEKGEKLVEIHARTETHAETAARRLEAAIEVSDDAPAVRPVLLEPVSA